MDTHEEPSRNIPVKGSYDVLVIGGGPAGIGAALGAARTLRDTLGRKDARVLVVEQLNSFGGVGGAGGHGYMCLCNAWGSKDQVVGGVAWELLTRLNAEGHGDLHPGSAFYDVEWYKFMVERMFQEAGIEFLYHTFFCETIMDGDAAVGAIIQNKTGRQAVYAKRIIDCTGDADVAASAGCEYEHGRPGDGKCQPTTLMFTIGGVNWDKVKPWRTDYQMEHVWKEAQKNGDMEPFQSQIMGFWWNSTQPSYVGINFTHMTGIDSTKAEDLTRATVEGRRQAYHMIPVFRKYVPGMEDCYLISTGSTIGLRESRRILGEYRLTEDEIKNECRFDDAICYGAFFIDIHALDEGGMEETTWRPPKNFRYQIPYRSLVPRKIDGILTAGRCISVTHVGLGSVRVMSQCTATGEAAGTAAALSLDTDVMPRSIDTAALREQLRQAGGIMSDSDIRPFET